MAGSTRAWCFTDNECKVDVWAGVWNSGLCRYLVVGREVAPSTGQTHLQGYLYLHQKSRLAALKKLHPTAHFEPALGTPLQASDYCKKDGDYSEHGDLPAKGARSDLAEARDVILRKRSIAEVYQDEDPQVQAVLCKYPRYVAGLLAHRPIDPILDPILRPWQSELLANLQADPHPREIIWVWETTGNVGKTWFSRLLVSNYGAIRFENAKSADIAMAYSSQSIVCFDYSRSQYERINYSILESLKNGMLFSPKYESCHKVFPVPHVVVFANWLPDKTQFSADRIRYVDLNLPQPFPIFVKPK